MVAVRIPGAESIDRVAVARDPGVRATPEDFGAQIGEGMQHLGNAAVEVGALMDRKREAAAAAMALPEATAKFQLAAVQRQQKIPTEKPTSAAATGQQVDTDLAPTQEQIIQETKAKYGLNDLAAAKLTGHLTTIRGHAVVSAVTEANNQIVKGLGAAHDDTVKTIASTAMATGDVDGALKQVDQSVTALRGIVPENDLNAKASSSKKVVVDSVIAGMKAAGNYDKAEELTKRFYGSVPSPSQAVYDAIYAQESGSGRNTSTSVTGARGGMQIQPETFKQYARPGERIDNETDNLAVGKRIIDDLSAKSGGDPARIAVGYFSGAGNIAPPGSPTPWKQDRADPTGKTVSSYVADVLGRVNGKQPQKAEIADPERALYWHQQITSAKTAAVSTASNAAENDFTRKIIDASAGIGPLPSRSEIEANQFLGESTRNALLAKYDSAASDVIKLQGAMKKFTDPNGGDFNPFSKDDKDNVDRIFNSLGGDTRALEIVTNRTGMVPEGAVTALRGSLISSDPQKVEQALQVSANLVGGKFPDVFANVKGGEDLTKTANTFRHYVYDRGMTAADAAKRIIEERTPEYEQRVKAKIKSEDVNEIVKKQLSDGDIRHAFDDSWIPFNDPKLTFSPEMRTRAMGDYEEAFRENFIKNGDVALSKQLALDDMKRTWGTTQVNGSKVVMKYPPERSPVYSGIENVSEHIAEQAVTAIKDLNGVDIPRSNLRLDEVRNTAERYMRGQPPVYVLSYTDKNGHVQTIPKQFYADPNQMRDKQTAERAAQSAKIQTRVDIDADNADLSRANFGVQ
ncbi:soluble lytic murein transglycosylase-like protein [Bradyrhizobium ottawaense]|uniref:lytic transglycosylase domain-containing protein n=1 Tax=Bradyrhizobium ottawaense TaxID=931866 RepID=UPI0038338FF0